MKNIREIIYNIIVLVYKREVYEGQRKKWKKENGGKDHWTQNFKKAYWLQNNQYAFFFSLFFLKQIISCGKQINFRVLCRSTL